MDKLINASLERPVPPEIAAMAEHVRRLHDGAVAVLAYGSCLRGVGTDESLIDLYVLTGDLAGVSRHAASRLACRLAPPNVYYAECDHGGRRYRAKYAVLPLSLFARWMTAANPYFWARFAQPSALVFAANEAARSQVAAAVKQAASTMYAHARGLSLSGSAEDPLAAWTAGFAATYATELRAETASRAASLVAANADYYRGLASGLAGVAPVAVNWRARRIAGKLWSVVRLLKAAFTFTGGADYLVWKIERHSGHKIVLSQWQRRHPILGGLLLLPQLLKRGAVR